MKDIDMRIKRLEYMMLRLGNHMPEFALDMKDQFADITQERREAAVAIELPPSEPEQPVLQNDGNIFWTPLGSRAKLNHAERKVMENHNLDDLRQKETYELVGFVCKGCGKTYTSIQDRALRQVGPGGCDGCLHKMKWG